MASWDQWLIVIPARLQSTRLPEKPLQDLAGKPLIIRVQEQLQKLKHMGATIVVATDSDKVLAVCKSHGVHGVLTSVEHQSGTDRVHEVSQGYPHRYILNVQGDEPFVDIDDLDRLAEAMEVKNDIGMGTLVYSNQNQGDFENPNVVKAIISEDKKALYFSRSPIPFHRDNAFQKFWQHQGIYAYTRKTLDAFCKLQQHPLEELEKLEQLRALGFGIDILAIEAMKPSIGIDTPKDLEEAREKY